MNGWYFPVKKFTKRLHYFENAKSKCGKHFGFNPVPGYTQLNRTYCKDCESRLINEPLHTMKVAKMDLRELNKRRAELGI